MSITEKISSFNPSYHFIDDNREYMHHSRLEDEIRAELDGMSYEELTAITDEVHTIFVKYFDLNDRVANAAPATPTRMSIIMTIAHSYRKDGLFTTWSDCLKASHLRYKLVSSLYDGATSFEYVKVTGEVRKAIGIIDRQPNTMPANARIVKYRDLQANGWRSCRVDRLLSITVAA